MKIDISGFNRITFQGGRLHRSSSYDKAKTKLAILAFLYCGQFVKNPIVQVQTLYLLLKRSLH